MLKINKFENLVACPSIPGDAKGKPGRDMALPAIPVAATVILLLAAMKPVAAAYKTED